jgi:ABC-type uncharacterized transport system permease subunit
MKLGDSIEFCHNVAMSHVIFYWIVCFIYCAVAFDFWRTAETPSTQKLHSAMIALALILHGGLLYEDVFSQGFNFGLMNALSTIFWLTVLIYWLANLKHRLTSLQALVLPPAALFALLPGLFHQSHQVSSSHETLFLLHITIALIAYSLFTFAAMHAVLMTIAERSLHNRPTLIKLPTFPPLMVMENLLFRVISIAFVLLTCTLISGMLFSEAIFGKPLQFNHKVIFSIASWWIYGWLLFGRWRYGWRGKKAIRLTLWGFVLLLLAYVGSKFVLEVILHRS